MFLNGGRFESLSWQLEVLRQGPRAEGTEAVRIAIGSDHAGFELKQHLVSLLPEQGHHVTDVGTYTPEAADYPDSAEAVSREVLNGRADRGIVICGSGIGACIAANKIPGIRAGLCHDPYSAAQGVEHDDMNVLVLGARIITREAAELYVQLFLAANFTPEDRHLRRLEKVRDLELRACQQHS